MTPSCWQNLNFKSIYKLFMGDKKLREKVTVTAARGRKFPSNLV
jgi:abortive infection bacteriophage resistance protein